MDSWQSRLCIAFSGYAANNSYETMVFVVDLSLPTYCDHLDRTMRMNPTVRLNWESFSRPGVCLLGSKLYVFDEYHAIRRYPNYQEKFKTDGKCVFTFELSGEVSNLNLEKEMMHKEESRMNHTKVRPKATVTPDGKILVFSSLIEVDSFSEDGCNFELYDPDTEIWHNLPNLPVSQREGAFFVRAFTFIKKKVFLLQTKFGVFTLDLKNPVEWKTTGSGFCGDGCIPAHCGDSFIVIEKDLCIIPHAAFDIRVRGMPGVSQHDVENIFDRLEFTFPGTPPISPLSKQSLAITLPDYDEKRSFRVCVMRSGINNETKRHELLLSVYETDLPSCKTKLTEYRKNKVKEDPIWWKRKKESFVLPNTSNVMEVRILVPENSPEFAFTSFSSVKN